MSSPLQKALGQKIRSLRLAQGFSQEGFADHCGVHRTFTGALERGETNISFDNLAKIARGLKLTLAQMLEDVEDMATKNPANDNNPSFLLSASKIKKPAVKASQPRKAQ